MALITLLCSFSNFSAIFRDVVQYLPSLIVTKLSSISSFIFTSLSGGVKLSSRKLIPECFDFLPDTLCTGDSVRKCLKSLKVGNFDLRFSKGGSFTFNYRQSVDSLSIVEFSADCRELNLSQDYAPHPGQLDRFWHKNT